MIAGRLLKYNFPSPETILSFQFSSSYTVELIPLTVVVAHWFSNLSRAVSSMDFV